LNYSLRKYEILKIIYQQAYELKSSSLANIWSTVFRHSAVWGQYSTQYRLKRGEVCSRANRCAKIPSASYHSKPPPCHMI
jgi:hypothetical protein